MAGGGYPAAPAEIKAEAIASFTRGTPIGAVAREAGYSEAAVRKWLRAAGINPVRRKPPAVAPTDFSGAPKLCTRCRQTLPANAEHFYLRARRGRTELTPECRECLKERTRARNARNPGRVAAANKRWRTENADYVRRRAKEKRACRTPAQAEAKKRTFREWLRKRRDHVIQYRLIYHAEKREMIRERSRRYYEENRDARRAHARAYKARRKRAEGTFTRADLEAQYERQSGRCYWCAEGLESGYHADHYIPLKRGGTNWPDNIVLACETCNLSRQDKLPEEFLEFLKLGAPAWSLVRKGRAPLSLADLPPRPTPEEVAARRAYHRHHTRKYRAKMKALAASS